MSAWIFPELPQNISHELFLESLQDFFKKNIKAFFQLLWTFFPEHFLLFLELLHYDTINRSKEFHEDFPTNIILISCRDLGDTK